MPMRDTLSATTRGHLLVAGCDTVDLARTYGTPLRVLDESLLRQRCRLFARAVKDASPSGGAAFLWTGALDCHAVLAVARQEGMNAATVGLDGALTALAAGFRPDQVLLHGAGYQEAELAQAVRLGLGAVVVSDTNAVAALQDAANQADVRQTVLLRINAELDAAATRSGGYRSEHLWGARQGGPFGLGLDDGGALDALKKIAVCPNLRFAGLHTHLGVQIETPEPYLAALDKLTDFILLGAMVLGFEPEWLNVGGGFAARATDADDPTDPQWLVHHLAQQLRMMCQRKGVAVPKLAVEPGRAVLAECGVTLTRVLAAKPGAAAVAEENAGAPEWPVDWLILDTPPRPQAHPALARRTPVLVHAARVNAPPERAYHLVGKHGSPQDVQAWGVPLPETHPGDLLAWVADGARPLRADAELLLMARFSGASVIRNRWGSKERRQLDEVPSWLKQ